MDNKLAHFLTFVYALQFILFAVCIYFALNGGLEIPTKRQGLTKLEGWAVWLFSSAPVFLGLFMATRFDQRLKISNEIRGPLSKLFQALFFVALVVAGYNAILI